MRMVLLDLGHSWEQVLGGFLLGLPHATVTRLCQAGRAHQPHHCRKQTPKEQTQMAEC